MIIRLNNLCDHKWQQPFDPTLDSENTAVLIFSQLTKQDIQPYINEIIRYYPQSLLLGCSTAGQIQNGKVLNGTVLVTIIKFEKSTLAYHSIDIENPSDSFNKGMHLANKFIETPELNNILVLSEGLNINGSQLIDGINTVIENKALISGGLAGDDDRFEKTWVINEDKKASENCIAALAIYGKDINTSSASKGGWDMIGIDRQVTNSTDNILYELDHKPALEIYKQYLGEYAENLPSSGLLFPLALIDEYDQKLNQVRTILAVDHEKNSITFAGDIPKWSMVRLMHANFDRLIDGAGDAAKNLVADNEIIEQDCLCISISCVGRKLILGQRIDEELEAVQNSIPKQCIQTGFYSYGELSPLANGTCDLHNQTMTLTLLWEN